MTPVFSGATVDEIKECLREAGLPENGKTTLHDGRGGAVRITDVAPIYRYAGRMFTPMMLLRRIVPVSGSPRIRIQLRPARDYWAAACDTTHGSNHSRYLGADTTLRGDAGRLVNISAITTVSAGLYGRG